MSGRRVSAFVILLLLVVAWRGQYALQFGTPRAPGGWVMLAAALALFATWLFTRRSDAADGSSEASTRREWLLALAACAVGVAFRTIYFTSVPGGMNHDAAFNGMYALHVLQGAPYTPYVSAAWGRETLFMYVCTALVAMFGNTPEPIQLAATLVAIATLPLFYLFARALFGPRIALVALALLAVSGWHNVFSRVGWRMIMVPPFELIALFGIWRALQTGWWRHYALAGAGMALAIYTYDAGRIVPPMVVGLLGLFMLVDRRDWSRRIRGGLLAVGVFLVVGAPMLWYAATHFEQFKARAAHLAEAEHAGLLPNVLTAVQMFNYRGNGNDFFIHEPLLEPLTGALFVFSLLAAAATLIRHLGRRRPPLSSPPAAATDAARADLFTLAGLAIALVPGILATPNGNRSIAALPFVYVLIGRGLVSLADAVAGAMNSLRARRALWLGVIATALVIAAVETYSQFLGRNRRPIIGFDPEATAAGEYLRRFGSDYSRYVVAERWPEYTLAYLSYNGGGTPLENQYVIGRTLGEIESQINRFGRKGLLFVLDDLKAGQEALERLQRLFANARVEPIVAVRLGGKQIGSAVIVEPQSAAHTGLWSNSTRTLAVGGDSAAAAQHCFAPVGDAAGVSLRVQLMLPAHEEARANGGVALLDQCPSAGGKHELLRLMFAPDGLELHANKALPLRAWSLLDAGRWYDVTLSIDTAGQVSAAVDGEPVAASGLRAGGPRPPRVAGFSVTAPAGGQFYLDDLSVVPGVLGPADPGWGAAEPTPRFRADFEDTAFGAVSAGDSWKQARGPVSVLHGPVAPAAEVSAAGGNAFDGGRGTGPGMFDQPVGIAADAAGDFYVADKNNHRIQKFAPDGSFLLAWGQQGARPGDFKEPHDVAADDEFVYVADTWNQRIQAFDRAGRLQFVITGKPSFSSPRGVFAAGKRIYVAEAGGGRITVYDRAGELQQTIGTLGEGPGQLLEPVDVALDSKGDVWVVNGGNNRLEHFGADGKPIGSIPVPGWTGKGLKESYLTIGPDDTLYLGDWGSAQVLRFRPDGTALPPLGENINQPSGILPLRDRILVVSRADALVKVLELPRK